MKQSSETPTSLNAPGLYSTPVASGQDGPSGSNLMEATHKLSTLTRQLESFFEMQIERIRHALRRCQDLKAEGEVGRRLVADVQEQRRQLEAERDAEIKRLAKASDDLAEAWSLLEEQQRQLLIDQKVQEHKSAPSRSNTALVGVARTDEVESSIFDFQQLQRQVREHAQRSR